MSNPCQSSHAAWNNHHGVQWIGAAGKRNVHALKPMSLNARWELQTVSEFGGNDRLRVLAQNDVDFMLLRVQIIEQTLRVDCPARASHGQEDSHGICTARIPRSMA